MHDLANWLRLKSVPGIGNRLIARLHAAFGTAEQVFAATPKELASVSGISHDLARTIVHHPITQPVRKELQMIERGLCSALTLSDPAYPPLLREITDPPAVLYIRGRLKPEAFRIAVVGSRNATPYGMDVARSLSTQLVAHGIEVISGMAMGIDSAAHWGCIESGGTTVAVLGSGVDRIYPFANQKLYHAIIGHGAVISEFPMGQKPESFHFPMRNRIICGLCHGVVVVEAAKKSGSLITARLAAEQGREVFAVPGSVNSFRSTGAHDLLKQGAKLVASVADILEEFPAYGFASSLPAKEAKPDTNSVRHELDPQEFQVFSSMSPYPEHVDAIGERISMAPGNLSCILMQLELKGLVRQYPGNQFAVINEDLF